MKLSTTYFCLALCLLLNCSKTLEGDLIITNVNIIDVKTGNIESAMDIVINADTIASILIHKGNTKYHSENIINATDKYLIPGLWDMHAHSWWAYENFFPLLIANGVTGIREMLGDFETLKRIREEIKDGKIIGPMIVSCGPIVDGNPPSWDGSDIADTPEKGREIVRNQKENGAEFIKVYFSLENDIYKAIADESKKLNIPIGGHIPSKVSLIEALKANHHGIEHYWGVLDNCADKQKLEQMDAAKVGRYSAQYAYDRMNMVLTTLDSTKIDSTIQLLGKHKAWITPTFMAHLGALRENDNNYKIDKHVDYLPNYIYEGWKIEKDSILSETTKTRIKIDSTFLKHVTTITKPLLEQGAQFLAGTDIPVSYTYPGFSLHEELSYFVTEAGFTPLEALQTATINPAIFLKKEDKLGTVQPGKLANLLLLEKNPIDDINNTRSIHSVIVSGKYLEGEKLRDDIEAIATKNRLPKIYEVLQPIITEQGVEKAIVQYHQLKKEQPNAYNYDEEQLNTLGYELMESGKTHEAVKILELNIEVYPDYINGYDSLGDGYLSNGEKEKALDIWEKAVAKGSYSTRPKLEQLKKDTKQ